MVQNSFAKLRERAQAIESGKEVKKQNIKSLKNNKVTSKNALVRAHYSYSLNEKRLMCLIISKVNTKASSYNHEQGVFIDFASFEATYGYTSSKAAKNALIEALKGLYEKNIKNLEGYDFNNCRLITDHKDNLSNGIRFLLNKNLLPYIQGLDKHFTSYNLRQACDFNSSYAWRIYELLISWCNEKEDFQKIDIQEIAKIIGAPEDTRRSRLNSIINKSIEDIVEKSDLYVEYDTHKEQRKISAYTFYMRRK